MPTFFNEAISEKSPYPDGQPHVTLPFLDGLGSGSVMSLACRIASPLDLVNVGLAVEAAKANDLRVDLRVCYLMGGRMDRRLSKQEPYTLKVICGILNSFGLNSISVFCPHSQATSDLLDNYREFPDLVEDCFYDVCIRRCMQHVFNWSGAIDENWRLFSKKSENISIVFPDAGASKRFSKMEVIRWYRNAGLVTLYKDRVERTGEIRGTKILGGEVKPHCIIVDDLCDGGATFKSAAVTLRKAGAETVSLVVPHGIFSKGTRIEGVDFIATSNSYKEHEIHETFFVNKV